MEFGRAGAVSHGEDEHLVERAVRSVEVTSSTEMR